MLAAHLVLNPHYFMHTYILKTSRAPGVAPPLPPSSFLVGFLMKSGSESGLGLNLMLIQTNGCLILIFNRDTDTDIHVYVPRNSLVQFLTRPAPAEK